MNSRFKRSVSALLCIFLLVSFSNLPGTSGNNSYGHKVQASQTSSDTEVPTTPTNLISPSMTSTTVDLSWTASTDNVGVTAYDVYSGSTVVNTVYSTNCTISGLIPNTTYSFYVNAKDAAGNISNPSNVLNVTTHQQVDNVAPSTPTNLTVLSKTDTTIALSWNGSTDNVGVQGYVIYNGTTVMESVYGTSYTLSSLSPMTIYSLTVRAKDYAGNISEASNMVEVTTLPANVPLSIPANISTVATQTTISLTWDQVLGATSYEIEADGNLVNVTNTEYKHTGLNPNRLYTYKVRAKNANTTSEWSNTISQTTLSNIPSNIITTPNTTSVTISWDKIEDATGYDIEVDNVVKDIGLNTNYKHDNLSSKTQHSYRVRSRINSEISEWSTLVSATTTVLSVPRNIRATYTNTDITVTWDAVAEALEYEIEVDGFIVSNVTKTSYLHKELTPNTQHTYRVRARNTGGTSDWSNTINPKTSLLNIPTNVLTTGTETSVIVSWIAVADATSYDIEVDGVTLYNTTGTLYTHSGLANNTVHTYRVRAKNTTGVSSWTPVVAQSTSDPSTSIKGEWVVKPNMQKVRYNMGAAEIDGKIYVIGGADPSYLAVTQEYDTATGLWVDKSNMPTPRHGHGVVKIENKIYAIGGFTGSVYTNKVEVYDQEKDEWTTKANMPTARMNFGIAEVNGKIYAIGGTGSSTSYLNTVEEYDPVNDIWSTKAAMPTARAGLGVAVVDGKIYAFGGSSGANLNIIEEYDPVANTWTKAGVMPSWKSYFGTVVVEGKVFIMGGTNNNVELYDPKTKTWVSLQNIPTNRSSMAVVVSGKRIYAIGGSGTTVGNIEVFLLPEPSNISGIPNNLNAMGAETTISLSWDKVTEATGYDMEVDGSIINNGTSTTYTHSGLANNSVHTYRVRSKNIAGTGQWSAPVVQQTADTANSLKGEWITKQTMLTGRYGLGVAEVSGKIYAMGGYNYGTYSTVEEYDPVNNTWIAKKSMATARRDFEAVTVNGKIYAIGGYDTDKVEEYDPATNSWTTKTIMANKRYSFGCAVVAGKIYIIGGYGNTGRTNLVEEYDPVNNTWTRKANMPTIRSNLKAVEINGKIYAIGGYTGSAYTGIVEEYDPVLDKWSFKGILPIPKCDFGITAINGKIYIFGGSGNSAYLDKVEEYDPVQNICTTKTNLTTGRSLFGVVYLDNKVYVIGGAEPTSTPRNKVEAFILSAQSNIPYTPTNVSTSVSGSNITITWDAVKDATSYEVEIDGKIVNTGVNTTYSHNNLTSGIQHSYRVRSKNIAGVSEWSQSLNEVVNLEDYTSDLVPQMTSNTTPSPYVIQASSSYSTYYPFRAFDDYATSSYFWYINNVTPPQGGHYLKVDFGSGVAKKVSKITLTSLLISGSNYGIKDWELWASNDDVNYTKLTQGVQANNSQLCGYNFTNDTGYRYYRLNILSSYYSLNGSTVGMIEMELMGIADTSLNVPASISSTSTTTNSITLTWPAVAGAIKYDIDVNGVLISNITGTTYTHSGLTPGAKYTYRVRAKNATQISNWSAPFENITMLNPPTNITIPATSTSITIQWLPVENAVGYDIYVDGVTINNDLATSYTHTGLTPNSQHSYKVKVRTTETFSDWSGVISRYTAPATPANISAASGGTSITLSWPVVTGATGYDIEVDGQTVNSVTTTSYTHGGFALDTWYKFKVRSKSSSGVSDWSEEITAKTLFHTGTAQDPHIISTRQDLEIIRDNLYDHFKLINDIDLENIEWIPAGTNLQPFKGTLDGNGFAIRNLTINKPNDNNIGLIGCATTGTVIKNLRIIVGDGGIAGNRYVGTLLGASINNSNIEITNCSMEGSGTIKGKSGVGGLAGTFVGRIKRCNSTVNVEAIDPTKPIAGGLISMIDGGSSTTTYISECYSTGNVTALNGTVGGLVCRSNNFYGGSTYADIHIDKSYSTGILRGNFAYGIISLYSDNVSGRARLYMTNCFSLSQIEANGAYGIAYYSDIHLNSGVFSIVNCYYVGTLIGTTKYGISNDVYSNNDLIKNNYFNAKLADIEVSNGSAKLTHDMVRQGNYAGWDYVDIWEIEEGRSYPFLRALPRPTGVSVEEINEVAGGMGTSEAPYIIKTEDQLNNMRYNPTASYKLGNDIELTKEWKPIGSRLNTSYGDYTLRQVFKGIIDGDGYAIKNLVINKPNQSDVAFISCAATGTVIKNLKIIIGEGGITGVLYVGGLLGSILDNSTIEITNCSIEGSGTVKGWSGVGGLACMFAGRMTSCNSTVNVEAADPTYPAGGLIGMIHNGVSTTTTISECYSTGNVTALNATVGGLVGAGNNSYGIYIDKSYSIGTLKGRYVFGIIGVSGYSPNGYVSNCFSLSRIEATDGYGIANTYSSNISSEFKIVNCYYAGTMVATKKYGISNIFAANVVKNNYFNAKLADIEVSDGSAKFTYDMVCQGNYAGWDYIDIWEIEEGGSYPYLKALPRPTGVSVGEINEVAGGMGTREAPYIIKTEDQLNNMRYNPTASYKLGNDIELTKEWKPIGSRLNASNSNYNNMQVFKGVIDGDGYSIKNLVINKPNESDIGFISCVATGTVIKNLKIVVGQDGVTGGGPVGGLLGSTTNDDNIEITNCFIEGSGTIRGNNYVGGLAGKFVGRMTLCNSKVNVEAMNQFNTIAGGLIAISNEGTSTTTNISECYSTGNVTALNGIVGGLVGRGTATYSGSTYYTNIYIDKSYSTGTLKGRYGFGIIGIQSSTGYGSTKLYLSNCFSLSPIEATDAYGIAYFNYSSNPTNVFSVTNSYFAGTMVGTTKYGISNGGNSTLVKDNYFDATLNPTTNTGSGTAKTTAELKRMSTFTGWDFVNIWRIIENTSYPYLNNTYIFPGFKVTGKTETSISLAWNSIADATRYEIEVDGIAYDNGNSITFDNNNLSPGTTHRYRVRSWSGSNAGYWSATLTATTLLGRPVNVIVTPEGSNNIISWDLVAGAVGYEVEVDGTLIDNGANLTYSHNNATKNAQHRYRVKAKTADVKGNWSDVAAYINWSNNIPELCIAANNWVTETGSEVEVVLKANAFDDMYTTQIELQYDTQKLQLNKDSVKYLVWQGEDGAYVESNIDTSTGKIKVLLSGTGNVQGKDGQFDIMSLKFRLNSTDNTPVKANISKFVNTLGEYIAVPQVIDLTLGVLPKS